MVALFLSYRRSDSREVVARVYDRLVAHFSGSAVFRDLDSIPLGKPFPTVLQEELAKTTAGLVVIGPGWASATDEQGRRRLDDPTDFVRQEVEALLSRPIPVIPCLILNAPMPTESELPEAIRPLRSRQAIEVRPDPDFHRDMDRLIAQLGGWDDVTQDASRLWGELHVPSVPHQNDLDIISSWIHRQSEARRARWQAALQAGHTDGCLLWSAYVRTVRGESSKLRIDEAVMHVRSLANAGNSRAQYLLGILLTPQYYKDVSDAKGAMAKANYRQAYNHGPQWDWLRLAAEAGDPLAQFTAAQFRKYVRVSHRVRREWLRAAIRAGHIRAMDALRNLYYEATHRNDLTDELREIYVLRGLHLEVRAARMDSSEFTNRWHRLGDEFRRLGHVKHALQCYLRQGKVGNVPAAESLHTIGKLFESGSEIDAAPAKAVRFYTRAARTLLNINSESTRHFHRDIFFDLARCHAIGIGTAKSVQKAVKWCLQANTNDTADGYMQLAEWYATGIHLPLDYEEAAECLRRIAVKYRREARAWALRRLHILYRVGFGVEKDEWEAFQLAKNASATSNDWTDPNDLGDATFQLRLGECYELGIGIAADPVKAVKRYRQAVVHLQGEIVASQDELRPHPVAIVRLARCYETGTGVTIDRVEAARLYCKLISLASEEGNANFANYLHDPFCKLIDKDPLAEAQFRLAHCHAKGHGVKKDRDAAIQLLKAAASRGHCDAIEILSRSGLG